MATRSNIRTGFDGAGHDADLRVIRAADHGARPGTRGVDGARRSDGVAPTSRTIARGRTARPRR